MVKPGTGISVDVCIVGAGWSGLYACKYALEHRLSVVVLERRGELGGVWSYSDNPGVVTVMESTISSSSATVTEASDFPMPEAYGHFVHREDVQDYLEGYARRFDLHRHIVFNQTVEHVDEGEVWTIRTRDACYRSRFLVICAGRNQRKRENIPDIRGYAGPVTHAGDLKSIPPGAYGRHDNVLVYGGGESASDVVELLVETPARITWAIPGGQHFFRKAVIFGRPGPGRYRRTDAPLDEATSRCIQHVAPFGRSKPGMRWLCTLGSTGSFLKYEGHGIPEWKKNVPFMHAMVNKNGHVVEHVHAGRVTAQGRIASCNGRTVTFRNGRSDAFTHLILCTGYEADFPWLPRGRAPRSPEECYKLVFHPDRPSLLFLGMARPTVGSIPMMTELQCMYAFQVLGGRTALPDRETMCAAVREDVARRDRFFEHTRRPDALVCPFQYGYELATLAGTAPDYLRLLLESPATFMKTFFSPANAAHFRLADLAGRRQAVGQIWARQSAKWFIWPWVYLAARLLKLDVMFDYLSDRSYRRQIRSGTSPPNPERGGPRARVQELTGSRLHGPGRTRDRDDGRGPHPPRHWGSVNGDLFSESMNDTRPWPSAVAGLDRPVDP